MKIPTLAMAAAMTMAVAANAAPFAESDPYPAATNPKPTTCTVFIDAAAGVDSPVLVDSTGTYCHYDLSAIGTGAHSAKATFGINDAVWGKLTSPMSNTVNFTRPAAPLAPANFTLSAQ